VWQVFCGSVPSVSNVMTFFQAVMMKRLLIAAIAISVGLVNVVDAGVLIGDAKQMLYNYKQIVVNGKKEGDACNISENTGADKDKVYNWLGEVAGKTPEEVMALTFDESPVAIFEDYEKNGYMCAVSMDLYCKDNGDGTDTCTKCGGTCGKKYVDLIMAATDWKDQETGGKGGGGGSPAPGPGGSGNAPAKNGAVTADGGYSCRLVVTVAFHITLMIP